MRDDALIEKEWRHAGRDCLAVLITFESGHQHRCGYVSVDCQGNATDWDVGVHGGLTFDVNKFLCDKKERMFVGFDCAHCDDTLEKWTLAAVVKETNHLAEQLGKLTHFQKLNWSMREFVKNTTITMFKELKKEARNGK